MAGRGVPRERARHGLRRLVVLAGPPGPVALAGPEFDVMKPFRRLDLARRVRRELDGPTVIGCAEARDRPSHPFDRWLQTSIEACCEDLASSRPSPVFPPLRSGDGGCRASAADACSHGIGSHGAGGPARPAASTLPQRRQPLAGFGSRRPSRCSASAPSHGCAGRGAPTRGRAPSGRGRSTPVRRAAA